jgi:hypothetical protein
MAIQIGKYKRPGIFIEEFDQSIISSPTVDGITNMVIGVSKKGPVNTPIRITSLGEFDSIFGSLDRGLERKGSFFHRTVSKMLETAPVFAINLLATDDNLDVIEYKSLSTATNYKNDVKREDPYRRFFDTTGFWKRDTESFISLTKKNPGYSERAISLTNLSDRNITAFIFKSAVSGFDRTLIEWYGSVEKMPPYVNPTDFASDYMVDIVIVSGDWSNYQELAVDNRWSSYFNSSGLRKDKVREFANDRNVNLLAFYEGISLIPYFRDANGRNIFIETTINRDSDRTGLFCAFNNDLVESDFSNGVIDLLGNGLVGIDEKEVDFLSYRDNISDNIVVRTTPLDLPGNVTAILPKYPSNLSNFMNQPHAFGSIPKPEGKLENGNNRTAWFNEGAVYGVKFLSMNNISLTEIEVMYEVDSDSYAIIGGKYLKIDSVESFIINIGDYPTSPNTLSYKSTFVIDQLGSIAIVNNMTNSAKPKVNTTDIVLGYIEFSINSNNSSIGSSSMNHVTVDSDGYTNLSFGSLNTDDYFITPIGSSSIKVEFMGTNDEATVQNYEQYRKIKMFNRLVDLIDSPNRKKMAMLINATTMEKVGLENITITNIVTSKNFNKSFILNTNIESSDLVDVINGLLVFYTLDNEFIPKGDINNNNKILMETKNSVADETSGVIAKYSVFYNRYFDGVINTSDFFYSNMISEKIDNITFIDGEDAADEDSPYIGNDYIIFKTNNNPEFEIFDLISIPKSNKNKGAFKITGILTPTDLTNLGFIGSGFYGYQVNEEVEYEMITDIDTIYNYGVKHYLKMYLDNEGRIFVEVVDDLLQSSEEFDVDLNNTLVINSRKSNFKQSIEIETPSGYVQQPNKILISASRYTEVKIGDFLEAFFDVESMENGQKPKRLTRILSKRIYTPDSSLVEITCDTRIATYNFGGDLQTMRYISIDNYINSYKAITLKGFRIRQESLPDGTDKKQNQILNIIAKGTPLFKAITNKEAIDFRYLVDSFGLGLIERSKQQLMDICGERLDCFGILNMPSIRQFKNSASPSFVNKEDVLQAEFIAKGGNPESNPSFLYSFGDGPGTTCVGYFTPYVMGNDNGRPVELPPAAFVATTYMTKHTSNISSITPWTISAGVTNGRIVNIAGLEINFTPEDIEFLNQAQINPLVFKRNRGYIIETENTAQTLYKSALSFIHVREVLIELERELSRMLLDFQWKFNTPEIRAEIKLRADVICETYVSRNGLFNYFNKIDEENNTPEIIDNQIGVLDTYVEPVKGMGIIVNNVTILRTGAIQSGGFINS